MRKELDKYSDVGQISGWNTIYVSRTNIYVLNSNIWSRQIICLVPCPKNNLVKDETACVVSSSYTPWL